MFLGSYYFKQKAREALKGNWQTALLVTFFSGALVTLEDVLTSLNLPNPYLLAYGQTDRYVVQLLSISRLNWALMTAVSVLALLLTPALQVGCNQYFLRRLQSEQPTLLEGLFSRMRILLKALWLYILMGVRIFLWSLLFFVPGILAALRYSMAPYYLADNPELTAGQAIEKSKESMKNMKGSYFLLIISFVGWTLLANVLQMLLMDINGVAALVAAQCAQLLISTYMTASCAAFYRTVSTPEGMDAAMGDMRSRLRQMGVDDSQMDFGPKNDDSSPDDDAGDDSQ